MGFFNLFGGGTSNADIEKFLQKGAVVVDVRTQPEFYDGHVEGSVNIPLNTIMQKMQEIKDYNKPIITCCRSGARSGSAANILKQLGVDVINGGPWQNVADCIK